MEVFPALSVKDFLHLKKNKLHIASAESAFILKPDGDYPELPANEHLTMTAARRVGFDVPPTGLVQVEKVGQAISEYTQASPLNLNDYFRRVLFCFLTANGDMHLKNWSLLEMEKYPGVYRLSPGYDWLNTRIALTNEKSDLAIPLGGKDRNMQKSYFRKFGLKELGLRESFVNGVFGEVPQWTTLLRELIPQSFLSQSMKDAYLEILEKRAKILS